MDVSNIVFFLPFLC